MSIFRRDREPSEAERARQKAERDLIRTIEETPAFRDLGERLRVLRQHNHFAEAISATFRGER